MLCIYNGVITVYLCCIYLDVFTISLSCACSVCILLLHDMYIVYIWWYIQCNYIVLMREYVQCKTM